MEDFKGLYRLHTKINSLIKNDELQLMIVLNEWIRCNSKNNNAKDKLFYKIPLFYHKIIIPGNDHEVEFHEIEIQLFQEVEFLIMRSKFNLFMRSNLSNNIDQEVDTSIMRLKLSNNAF